MVDLVHVDFNLTNACNLACTHCHSASGTALPEELTTDEILEVVHELHRQGVLSVAFAGGEPFMRQDIVAILSEACKLDGWRVSVITNGLFFSDTLVDQLRENCRRCQVVGAPPASSSSLLRTSVGLSQPRVCRGRSLSSSATAS
ncbi:radical SAM protein, partial [Gandjariella thermophila]|uniref:radical SAM protein n=1 Tax=Gandjariella thermophila TaxID=1931992 RepID=UPI0010F5C782